MIDSNPHSRWLTEPRFAKGDTVTAGMRNPISPKSLSMFELARASGTLGGRKDNDPPLDTAGNQWETIFDRALGRGVSARYYNSDLPFSAVWGARGATWTRPLAEYYADCALGTLPAISFVDPPFRDGGGTWSKNPPHSS